MNKKLISMAVGAALAAGTMVAQAAEESMAPTVYGKIHVGYGAVSDEYKASEPGSPDEKLTDADNMQFRSYASRLGIKGAVPITDSLKGTYGLEWEIDPGGDGTFKNRNQYAGLKAGFGEVRFGRHDTPTKIMQGKFDEFNDTDGDIVGALKMSRGDLRLNNAITYLSPDWSGFNFDVLIAPGEGNGCKSATNNDSSPACNADKGGSFGGDGPVDILSVAAAYNIAGFMVSLGFDQYDDKASGSTIPDLDTATMKEIQGWLDGAKYGGDYKDLMRLIATYGTKMFGVGALYETSTGNKDFDGNDKDVMGISGHVTLADVHTIKLQYMMGEQDLKDGETGTKFAKNEESMLSLGYDFKMGKATTVYAMLAQGEDKTTADQGGGSLKREYSSVGIGLIQNF
jgi:predicted porin